MRIKPAGKLIILILVLGAAFGAYRMYAGGGGNLLDKFAPAAATKPSTIPLKADIPDAPSSVSSLVREGNITIPGSRAVNQEKPEIRFLLWAWNSQMGLMFANGGPRTTEGSLMADKGLNLNLVRQDDPAKMQEELVTFATELSRGNKNPEKGAAFVAIMGDGSATFLKGVNDTLRKIGSQYQAKIIGSCGYSRGEDRFMGPKEWKENPQLSKGGVVSGYLRDGDWNIAQKWLGDNGLRNNPDEKTYDPDALNWVNANDYIDAAQKYIAGYSEERDVVRNGKKTGEKKRITVQGVVTWTPGDVTVAREKGGLVSIVSTKEYSGQMPNVIIGIDDWMKKNRTRVTDMLDAITAGGDLVRSNTQVLHHAAGVSAKVYGEEDADYWEKYYKGVTERDKTGEMVELGGSSVNNLADNLLLFGMVPGSANVFAATYKVFGDIVVDQYPDLVPSYYPVSQILDTSYLQALAKTSDPVRVAEATKPVAKTPNKPIRTTISNRSWNISFKTGSAAFTPQAATSLQRMLNDLLVAGNTAVEIHGHTDNVGDPNSNMALSEARAFAVKSWLEKRAPRNFPEGRIRVFAHGQQNPLVANGSEAGRARNRRVEIKIGTTN